MAHDHGVELGATDADKSRRLIFATAVTVGILVAEVIGSWLSGSLALLSDAAHVFADVLALTLSLLALRLACRVPTETRTYGLHRVEIFAALLNGLTLLIIAGLIGHEAWQRFLTPPEIKTVQMLVVALVGLAANALVLTRLSGHHHDLNMRGAYLHVLGDLLASVGVVAGALVMQLTGWYMADPIISALIGLLILGSAWRLLFESVHILLLGVPRHLNVSVIAAAMRQVADVVDIHNVRLWAPCSNVAILSAHVVTCAADEAQRVRVREELRHVLAHTFGITEVTLELEESACPANGLIEPVAHPEPYGHGHDH
ncbi:MAG: cation diffusion facilitator family transporter [Armatimonadetes bacterium]|nr:cation diffusion facilitator family transporter [Armatimonadota bacterium]